MYKRVIKRLLDLVISLMALPFVLIITLIVGPAIYLEDRGSVFYKANRRGLNGKIFQMYKFRSMKMNAPDLRNKDNSTYNSSNDPRVTHIGKILRKTSIDELPQVFNIIKGDMSIIGPRAPIPKEDVDWNELSDLQKKRLSVRPGLTGYTAALYRNSIPQEEKHYWDCYYVDHVSFAMDFKIFFLTLKTVFSHKNIYTNT